MKKKEKGEQEVDEILFRISEQEEMITESDWAQADPLPESSDAQIVIKPS